MLTPLANSGDDDIGVVYLLTGASHAARLVVSVYSLRKWYAGPITLFTTRTASRHFGELCAGDPALRVRHVELDEVQSAGGQAPMSARNGTYLTKIEALDASPYAATLFIDADTVIVGDISELLGAVAKFPLVVTEFCDWRPTDENIRKMLEQWRDLQNQPNDCFGLEGLLDAVMASELPTINTGVVGVHREAAVLSEWRALAHFGRTRFTPDETALQLLLSKYPHERMSTIYNCTPYAVAEDPQVRIWHFIGQTHLGHEASRNIWLPIYRECVQQDIARISQWSRVEESDTPPPTARSVAAGGRVRAL